MKDHEKTEKASEQEKRERPIDRVRRLAQEKGVPFRETTNPGERTLIFVGGRKEGTGGKGRGGGR